MGLADGINTVDGFVRENYGGPKDIQIKFFRSRPGSIFEMFRSGGGTVGQLTPIELMFMQQAMQHDLALTQPPAQLLFKQ